MPVFTAPTSTCHTTFNRSYVVADFLFLFYLTTVSRLDSYIESSGEDDEFGCERRRLWPVLRYLPGWTE